MWVLIAFWVWYQYLDLDIIGCGMSSGSSNVTKLTVYNE